MTERVYTRDELAPEQDRRMVAGICITLHYADRSCERFVFACDRPVSAKSRAQGCGICLTCEEAQEAEEGRCDGLAAARIEHQWYS